MSRRNIEINDRELLTDLIRKQRRRVEGIGEKDEDEEEELELEEILSPVAQRSKLTLASSADLGLEDYDSDSSYNSFRLSLEKKDLFAPESEPLNHDQLYRRETILRDRSLQLQARTQQNWRREIAS